MHEPEAEIEHCVIAVRELAQREREYISEMAEDQQGDGRASREKEAGCIEGCLEVKNTDDRVEQSEGDCESCRKVIKALRPGLIYIYELESDL